MEAETRPAGSRFTVHPTVFPPLLTSRFRTRRGFAVLYFPPPDHVIRRAGERLRLQRSGSRTRAVVMATALTVFVGRPSSAIQASPPAGAEPAVRRLWAFWFRFGLVGPCWRRRSAAACWERLLQAGPGAGRVLSRHLGPSCRGCRWMIRSWVAAAVIDYMSRSSSSCPSGDARLLSAGNSADKDLLSAPRSQNNGSLFCRLSFLPAAPHQEAKLGRRTS